MYNIEKIREHLDNISFKETQGEFVMKALLSDKGILDFCEEITKQHPYSKEGITFWHEELSREDKLKILFLLEHYVEESDDVILEIGCSVTLYIVLESQSVFCMVGRKQDEEGLSYIEACEEVLGFYLPQEDYETYHENAYEILTIHYASKSKQSTVHHFSRN